MYIYSQLHNDFKNLKFKFVNRNAQAHIVFVQISADAVFEWKKKDNPYANESVCAIRVEINMCAQYVHVCVRSLSRNKQELYYYLCLYVCMYVCMYVCTTVVQLYYCEY
jgi:hypothetical protein